MGSNCRLSRHQFVFHSDNASRAGAQMALQTLLVIRALDRISRPHKQDSLCPRPSKAQMMDVPGVVAQYYSACGK